jgi:hypothetical protein
MNSDDILRYVNSIVGEGLVDTAEEVVVLTL